MVTYNTTVLVTGAGGFIGSHVAYNLLKENYNEIAFICIAVENNLSYNNWKDTCLSKYFGTFVYRPVIHQNSISDEKIYHPIKQAFIGDQ